MNYYRMKAAILEQVVKNASNIMIDEGIYANMENALGLTEISKRSTVEDHHGRTEKRMSNDRPVFNRAVSELIRSGLIIKLQINPRKTTLLPTPEGLAFHFDVVKRGVSAFSGIELGTRNTSPLYRRLLSHE